MVWLEELVPLLVQALAALCGPRTLLLLAHQKRSERTDALLFEGLSDHFVMEKVSDGVSLAALNALLKSIIHERFVLSCTILSYPVLSCSALLYQQ